MNTLTRMKAALAQHPDLGIDGFRHTTRAGPYPCNDAELAARRALFFEPRFIRQVETACEYIREFGIDNQAGSYGLKHNVECWGRGAGQEGYVTNGCAILAAVLSGYQLVRERNSPNCRFGRPPP